MSVVLNPHAEAIVRQRIAAGEYSSPDEVIEDALQALEERDRLIRLRAAIAVGDADFARGKVIPFTDDLMDEIDREAQESIREGAQLSSDVVP
jgi:antitoxin ParD1/3/4